MNKLKLQFDSIIYILCPGNYKTGGPELLHQLYFSLKNKGYNVKLIYVGESENLKICEAFKKYTSDFSTLNTIEDDKKNILIVPETYTQLLRNFKNILTCIRWLSVDNYLNSINLRYNFSRYKSLLTTIKLAIKRVLRNKSLPLNKIELKNIDLHLVQSYYSIKFLNSYKIFNYFYLSDYINEKYINSRNKIRLNCKQNIVCYNPSKGYAFTKLIIEGNPTIQFVPIKNMTENEIINLLLKAKVYIDFGNHPGKDRLPREACLMGCCVITDKKGSAAYKEDVPIPNYYKIEDKRKNLSKISTLIKDCLNNYENNIKNFEPYINFILGEKDKFIDNCDKWFYF